MTITAKTISSNSSMTKYLKWVIYCRAPLTEDYSVIDYLGRYAYRVAIANSRIINIENGFVHFKYKDYRDNKEKILPLETFEFMRRFLLHVLLFFLM